MFIIALVMNIDQVLLNAIEEASSIVIFTHHFPDGDCLGSMNGLKKILKANYPDKRVYGVAESSKKWEPFFEKADEASDEILASSLAIVVDHNSLDRCCDPRVATMPHGIRFDHHIGGKRPYPYPALCEENACSASEVILQWCLRVGLTIPQEAVQDFYIAFCDDCRQYTKGNAPKQLQEIDDLMLNKGADKGDALYAVYFKTVESEMYENKVREKRIVDHGIAYALMTVEDYESLGVTYEEAGVKSPELGIGCDADVLLLFTCRKSEIRLSARSKGDFSVEELCSCFGGGGHKQAAGAILPIGFDINLIVAKAKEMKGL